MAKRLHWLVGKREIAKPSNAQSERLHTMLVFAEYRCHTKSRLHGFDQLRRFNNEIGVSYYVWSRRNSI